MAPKRVHSPVDSKKLMTFASLALQKVGVSKRDGDITADCLVAADLRGIDSHGVARLAEFYVGRIKSNQVNPQPNIQVERHSISTAVVDGGNGLGLVVSHAAMNEAIELAGQAGSGWVSVRNSTHCGAMSCYSMMGLPHDMVGFSFTTGGNIMSLPGGSGRRMGINAMSVAAPGNLEGPFVLDMATGVVAGGKFEIAQREKAAVPPGWSVDASGEAIIDPARFFADQAAVLPLGGDILHGSYKGFGLALVVDILSGLLSGSGGSLLKLNGPYSQAFGALRISAFTPVASFKNLMDLMIEQIREAPRLTNIPEIMYPGERENRAEVERLANGIPLHPEVVAELQALGDGLGIPLDIY